jgi:hypothetical protein
VAIYRGSTCAWGSSPLLLRQGCPPPALRRHAVSTLFGSSGRLFQLLRSKIIQNPECGGMRKETVMSWRNGGQPKYSSLGIQAEYFRIQVRCFIVLPARSAVMNCANCYAQQAQLGGTLLALAFQEIPAVYWTRSFIPVFKRSRRRILFRARCILPPIWHPAFLSSNITASSYQRLVIPSGLLPSVFHTETVYALLISCFIVSLNQYHLVKGTYYVVLLPTFLLLPCP